MGHSSHSSHSSHNSHINYQNHASTGVYVLYLGDYLNTVQYFVGYYYSQLAHDNHCNWYGFLKWQHEHHDRYYYYSVPVYYVKYYGALGAGHHNTQLVSITYIDHVNYHGTGHANSGSTTYNYSYAKLEGSTNNIAHVNSYQRNEFYQNKTKPVVSWKYLGTAQVNETHGISRALVEIKDKLNLIRFTSAGTSGVREAPNRSGDILSHALRPNTTDILWRGISQFDTFKDNILQIKKDLTGLTETIAGSTIDAAAVQTFKSKIDSISNIPVIANYYSLPFHSNSPHNNHFNHNNYNNLISYAEAKSNRQVFNYGNYYTNHANTIWYQWGYAAAYYSQSYYKGYAGNIKSEDYYAYNPGPAGQSGYSYHSNYYR